MALTARLQVDAAQGLSRAMIAAARGEFRRIATETGESAIENILQFAQASHGANPRPGQRSTSIHNRSNYAFLVTTIPRGVGLEMFVTNSDNNFLIKFHALNNGRRGRSASSRLRGNYEWPDRPDYSGPRARLTSRGTVSVRTRASEGPVAGSGFYRDAIRLALLEHNLT